MSYISNSPQETQEIAREFSRNLQAGAVVAFYGELGAGKTTFIQGIAAALGIKRKIPSPTFTLLRNYRIPKSSLLLNHLDLYRINSAQELGSLDFTELVGDPEAVTLIEWAGKIKKLLPAKRIDIILKDSGKNKRSIIIRQLD